MTMDEIGRGIYACWEFDTYTHTHLLDDLDTSPIVVSHFPYLDEKVVKTTTETAAAASPRMSSDKISRQSSWAMEHREGERERALGKWQLHEWPFFSSVRAVCQSDFAMTCLVIQTTKKSPLFVTTPVALTPDKAIAQPCWIMKHSHLLQDAPVCLLCTREARENFVSVCQFDIRDALS